MSSLIDTLTASKGPEAAGFINNIVEQLWPNITVLAANITKEVVEPILASTLPAPLSNLRFVKLDLGHVPLGLSNVDVHKTTNQGIKVDMDVAWDSVCDVELDGKCVPKIGIEKLHLAGRLSILLCPLLNIIPLIGAAQVAFIDTPTLKMDFTDAANIADFFLIEKTVRKTILGIISSMAVLPNRFLVKLDANNDWFKTYQEEHGILRLTIEKATGITVPKKRGASRFLAKIVKDIPDCYVKARVGGGDEWRTSVRNNNQNPQWNETHDFLVADFDQGIHVDIKDDDLVGDDDIGVGCITVRDMLLKGGFHELNLINNGESMGKLTMRAQFYNFVADPGLLSAAVSGGQDKDQICGLVTILIARTLGLTGQRDELNPSVKVTWANKTFQTAVKTYTPGTDIFNPSFDQAFKIPFTSSMIANPRDIRVSLMNKKTEVGSVEVPFQDVLHSRGMVKEGDFDVGHGASVRASISLLGIQPAQ